MSIAKDQLFEEPSILVEDCENSEIFKVKELDRLFDSLQRFLEYDHSELLLESSAVADEISSTNACGFVVDQIHGLQIEMGNLMEGYYNVHFKFDLHGEQNEDRMLLGTAISGHAVLRIYKDRLELADVVAELEDMRD